MKSIAITGGIGTGKSSVARILRNMGHTVISSDEIAHSLLQKEAAPFAEVIATFGPEVLDASGAIDRRALGAIVFNDPLRRARLEQILHPAIIERIQQATAAYAASGKPALFVEVPLLYEVGMESLFDQVWVVSAAPGEQRNRIGQRDHLNEAEIRQRMAAQLPLAEKEARADQVIVNNADFHELEQQVQRLLQKLELI